MQRLMAEESRHEYFVMPMLTSTNSGPLMLAPVTDQNVGWPPSAPVESPP
jgi:hypothetical protein